MLTRSGLVRTALLLAAVALVVGGALVFWRSADGGTASRRVPFPQIPAPDPWQGISWSIVESRAFLEAGTINGGAADGSSIVAWGEGWVQPRERPDPRDGMRPEPRPISVLWRSTDGETWKRSVIAVDGKPALPSRLALGPAGMAGIAHGVAVPGAAGDAAVVGSPDGDVWVSTAVPRGVDITDVLPTAEGFVAVGRLDGRPATWTLGAAAAAPAELPSVGRESEVLGGTAIRGELILMGRAAPEGGPEGVLWFGSAEGWTVHRAADLFDEDRTDGTVVDSIVPFAGGLFARGWHGVQPACLAAAGMVALTAGPLVADHGDGAAMCEVSWVSADGVTWIRAGMPAGQQGYAAVAAGGDGLLAMVDEAQPFDERRRPALWTTRDGLDWRRIGDVPTEAFGLLHAIPGRVVVIGTSADGTRPKVWLGTPFR